MNSGVLLNTLTKMIVDEFLQKKLLVFEGQKVSICFGNGDPGSMELCLMGTMYVRLIISPSFTDGLSGYMSNT